jgi:copper chaperone
MQFQIDNMGCGGCVRSVIKAIHAVDPLARVDVDLALKRVTIESGADQPAVVSGLTVAGFPPRPTV